MKFLFFILLVSGSVLADDLSYKDRSDEGESKYERIGKLEGYVSNLSSSLETIHTKMKKDFDKKLKELEKKLTKNIQEELRKEISKLRKSTDQLNGNMNSLLKAGKIPEYALAKDSKSIQFEVDIHKDRLTELIEKVVKIERQILDMTQ